MSTDFLTNKPIHTKLAAYLDNFWFPAFNIFDGILFAIKHDVNKILSLPTVLNTAFPTFKYTAVYWKLLLTFLAVL